MKTVITSNNSLLTILRSRSAIILMALTPMAFVLIQKTQALNPPPDGSYPGGNTAEGEGALLSLTSGTFNSNTKGKFNTAVGAGTLFVNTANDNTAVGAGALLSIKSEGRLGTATSSRRFKDGIKSMDKTSESLFARKPVRFHYKKEIDPTRTSQFGLVAEDVEKVDPALVVRDKEKSLACAITGERDVIK